ncbi:MAG: ATP-grasp domain-containing protein, partial [Rhodospirillales bacterium]
MTSRALLVVGGGSNQCGLIRAGKKFATTVIVSDINVNPPGRQFADIFASIDTRDKEANLALARRHDVSAVVTDQTDAAVPTCAYVAESLGLPGIGYELALRFTNKFVMRRILEDKLGDCIPEFSYFDHPSEADEWLTQLDSVSDWIVKPHTSQGSKGVARLSVEKHKTQLWDAFRASNFVGILLERYIVGEEYSVEAFVEQGDVHTLA